MACSSTRAGSNVSLEPANHCNPQSKLLRKQHWDMKHLAHKSFLWRGSHRTHPWIMDVRRMALQPASEELQQSKQSKTRWQRWQPCETSVLIAAKKQVLEAQNVGARRAKERWEEIESFCEKNGIQRTADQCKWKWERLMYMYSKINDWERKRSPDKTSFWVMNQDEKRAEGLAFNIDRETFDALDDLLLSTSTVVKNDVSEQYDEQVMRVVADSIKEHVEGHLYVRSQNGEESSDTNVSDGLEFKDVSCIGKSGDIPKAASEDVNSSVVGWFEKIAETRESFPNADAMVGKGEHVAEKAAPITEGEAMTFGAMDAYKFDCQDALKESAETQESLTNSELMAEDGHEKAACIIEDTVMPIGGMDAFKVDCQDALEELSLESQANLTRVDCSNGNGVQVMETPASEYDCHTVRDVRLEGDCDALQELSLEGNCQDALEEVSFLRADCSNKSTSQAVEAEEEKLVEGVCHALQKMSSEGICQDALTGCSNDSTSQELDVEEEKLVEGLHDTQSGGVFHLEETAELSPFKDVVSGSFVEGLEGTESQESLSNASSGSSVNTLVLHMEKINGLNNDLKTVSEDVNSSNDYILEQCEFGILGEVCEKAAKVTESELGRTAGIDVLSVQDGELRGGGSLDCTQKDVWNAQDCRLIEESLESQELLEALGAAHCLDVPLAVKATGLNEGFSVDVNECVKSQDSSSRNSRMTNGTYEDVFEKGASLTDTEVRNSGATKSVNVDEGKEGIVVLDDARVHSHYVVPPVVAESMTSQSDTTNAEEVIVEDGEVSVSSPLENVRESPENLTRAEDMQHNLYKEVHGAEASEGLHRSDGIWNAEEQQKISMFEEDGIESKGSKIVSMANDLKDYIALTDRICCRHEKDQDPVTPLQALFGDSGAEQGGEVPEMQKHVSDFVVSNDEQPHGEFKKSIRKDNIGTAIAGLRDDSPVGVPHPDSLGTARALKAGTHTEGMNDDLKDKLDWVQLQSTGISSRSVTIDSGIGIASMTDEASIGVTYPGASDVAEALQEGATCSNDMDGDHKDKSGWHKQLPLERSVRPVSNDTSLGTKRTDAVLECPIEPAGNSVDIVTNKKEDVVTVAEGLWADAEGDIDGVSGTGTPKESKNEVKESGGMKTMKQTNNYEDDLFTSMQAAVSNAFRNILETLGKFFKR